LGRDRGDGRGGRRHARYVLKIASVCAVPDGTPAATGGLLRSFHK
jgi:hypothetical protein